MTQKDNDNAATPSISTVSAQVSSSSSIALNSGCSSSKHEGGGCPACQKEGDLFVLPLRYAAVGKESGFPVLSLPRGTEGKFSAMPLTTSSYCTQMLREGFLYVLEERASLTKWRGFTVSEEGCLSEGEPESLPEMPPKFNCDVATHGVNAACINFQNSEQISAISMIFSPDKMTKSRLDYYCCEGKSELQTITPAQIKAGVNTLDEKRLDIIKPEDLLSRVLEFYLADFSRKKYDRGGHIAKRYYNTQLRIEEVENISGKPVPKLDKESINKPYSDMLFSVPTIDMTAHRYPKLVEVLSTHNGVGLVVNDAIGITQSLTDWRNKAYDAQFKDWFEEIDSEGFSNEDKYVIYTKINDIKEGYAAKRVIAATQQAVDNANARIEQMKNEDPLFSEEMEEKYRSQIIDYIRKDTQGRLSGPKQQENYNTEFQEKYWSRLDANKLAKFRGELEKRTKAANEHTVERDRDVLVWLKSGALVRHLDVYEKDNKEQGALFTEQIGRCFFGISSSPILSQALDRWWEGDYSDHGNLCWRAYLFNHEKAAKYLDGYVASAEGSNDIGKLFSDTSQYFDSLMTLYAQIDDAIERMQLEGNRFAMLPVVFADLGRSLLRGVGANKLDELMVKRFTGMIVASIGKRAADLNILEQLGQGVSQVDRNLSQRKGAYAQNYVSKNLKKVLDDPKVGNFYKVRLNGALAVLESVILINLIASSKGEGKDYLMLTAGIATLSATAFTMYAAYIDLSYGKRSVVVRASAASYLGKFSFWGGSLNFLAGGALAVSDIIDAGKSDKGILMYGYYFRFAALVAYSALRYTIAIEASAAWFDFVNKTTKSNLARASSRLLLKFATSPLIRASVPRMLVWVPYLGLIILVVTIGLLIFDLNALETWFKRCCFGKREIKDKYQNIEEEMASLSLAVQECI